MPTTSHTCLNVPCTCFSLPHVKARLISIANGSSHPAITPAVRRAMVHGIAIATTVEQAHAASNGPFRAAVAKWAARRGLDLSKLLRD